MAGTSMFTTRQPSPASSGWYAASRSSSPAAASASTASRPATSAPRRRSRRSIRWGPRGWSSRPPSFRWAASASPRTLPTSPCFSPRRPPATSRARRSSWMAACWSDGTDRPPVVSLARRQNGVALTKGRRKMSKESDFTRRDVLKAGIGVTALALGGGTPFVSSGRAYAAAADLSMEQLRTIGLSVTVQDRILADFKKVSGVGSTTGTAATYPDSQTKILSGSSDYDCWEVIGARLPAAIATNKNETIQAKRATKWKNGSNAFPK